MMKYGLIGEKLGHSFSPIIHTRLSGEEYSLCEIAKDKLDEFMKEKNFTGINVTIPYKETVLPYLDYIDSDAKTIGSVNTVVNREGQLYGYNTDAFGLSSLIAHIGIDLNGKTVAILGTGGTSKTAKYVSKSLGALEIYTVSRTEKSRVITYDTLYSISETINVIINTTPVGMYPNTANAPLDISRFPNLIGVVDAVYNPLSTRLILAAKKRGIPAEGGLYMLVSQAVRASEHFHNTTYPSGTIDEIYEAVNKSVENIVLIGMPSCGKTTVGRKLAELLQRELTDTDEIIKQRSGMEISDIFAIHGEEYFRELETEVIKDVSLRRGQIISTGGGAPLRAENVEALRQNGVIFFIDRPLELLLPTEDRPLSKDKSLLEKRYKERYPIYTSVCDVIIDGRGSVSDVSSLILESFK